MLKNLIITIISFIILINYCSNIVISNYDIENIKENESQLSTQTLKENNHELNEIAKTLSFSSNYFCENRGQLENDEVQFYAQDGSVWFTDDGVWFEVRDESSIISRQSTVYSPESRLMIEDWRLTTKEYKRVILKQEFIDANKMQPMGKERLSWNSNFFYGNDSLRWCTDVPNYREVWYKELYNGIDLRYYTSNTVLKYDLILHPGADPKQIRVKYEGADRLKIDDNGNILIQTGINTLIDGELFIYQEKDGLINQINGRFIQGNDELEYKFEISENYDKDHKLIIDPHIKLDFSTFIGGSYDEPCFSASGPTSIYTNEIAVDPIGNSYVSGYTFSSDFPTTPGANKTYISGIIEDGFIFKLNPNGTQLLFSTFIGGSYIERVSSIAVDTQGCSYITGGTQSLDFPVTADAFNTTLSGLSDCFALKLNQNGSKLIYSTFIGGSSADYGESIIIDDSGNSFITGSTYSSDFPTTSGAYDDSNNGGYDMFVVKLNNNGSKLLYSTYIGGNAYDEGLGITIDQAGNAYVTGITNSSDFPTLSGAFDTSQNGNWDCIVFKMNSNGTDLLFSTYIGGNYDDLVSCIVLDSLGSAIIAGETTSLNFPVVNGSYDTSIDNESNYDGFITKINSNGSKLIFSSFIGSQGGDCCFGITVDSWDYIYVTGFTNSIDFPITPDAIDRTNNGIDGFLLEMNVNCSEIVYSTFIGGTSLDWSSGIVIDHEGDVLITGGTEATDFDTTSGANDTTHNGNLDVFVQKYLVNPYLKINSISLLKNDTPTNLIYSRLGEYTFRITINDTLGFWDIKKVRLTLNSSDYNIRLGWDSTTNSITELYDPKNFIELGPSSKAYNISKKEWCIDFNVTFNWTFPDEDFQDVKVLARSHRLKPVWHNLTNFFRVENDLVFKGKLLVEGEDNRILTNNSIVRGGEYLTWTGPMTVYENTNDIYPPTDEFDVTIWDEDADHWLYSPKEGEPFNITTITPQKTTSSFNYTINLTGIPHECDKTNKRFTVRIDNENITFIHLRPYENEWQVNSKVYTSVEITDHGGGFVDNTSIMHSISEDNDSTWSAWTATKFAGLSKSITGNDFVNFEDGDDNFIKWRAKDSVGNGPVESEPYRILVDTNNVSFTNPIPFSGYESTTGLVKVGITISDSISGVNASLIRYSISTNGGTSWDSWRKVGGYQNGKSIDIRLNLTFPNGTDNRIRWRAYDFAGNGPAYSDVYVIKVNIPEEPVLPEVQLLTPENNSIISKSSLDLSWRIFNNGFKNVKFDVYVDTKNPPKEIVQDNLTVSNLLINELDNNREYYWTVIPKTKDRVGSCISGVWSFSVEIPIPRVKLITPENGSVIKSISPTLMWELEYNGSDKVTYELYFGTIPEPGPKMDKIPSTHFSIFDLDDNTTYYWYIIAWADELKGPNSEIWSFMINLSDDISQPNFDIDLVVYPSNLEIAPGDKSFVKATVTNLGDSKDNISLKLWIPAGKGIDVIFNGSNTSGIEVGDSYTFDLTVLADIDAKEDNIQITVVTESNFAKKFNLTVRKLAILTVRIKEPVTGNGDSDGPTFELTSWNILTILFLIIVLIIILIVISNRKKQRHKEENEKEKAKIEEKVSLVLQEPISPEVKDNKNMVKQDQKTPGP